MKFFKESFEQRIEQLSADKTNLKLDLQEAQAGAQISIDNLLLENARLVKLERNALAI